MCSLRRNAVTISLNYKIAVKYNEDLKWSTTKGKTEGSGFFFYCAPSQSHRDSCPFSSCESEKKKKILAFLRRMTPIRFSCYAFPVRLFMFYCTTLHCMWIPGKTWFATKGDWHMSQRYIIPLLRNLEFIFLLINIFRLPTNQ